MRLEAKSTPKPASIFLGPMYFFLQQRLKFSVNNTFSFSLIRQMKAISKPHLVDLLRMFDQKKWITPRIRYASVRSKGELLEDLERHFKSFVYGGVVTFVPKYRVDFLPKLEYNLKERASRRIFRGSLGVPRSLWFTRDRYGCQIRPPHVETLFFC